MPSHMPGPAEYKLSLGKAAQDDILKSWTERDLPGMGGLEGMTEVELSVKAASAVKEAMEDLKKMLEGRKADLPRDLLRAAYTKLEYSALLLKLHIDDDSAGTYDDRLEEEKPISLVSMARDHAEEALARLREDPRSALEEVRRSRDCLRAALHLVGLEARRRLRSRR